MSQISGSIHVAAPKPIDDRFRMFATLEECKAAIPSNERYQGLEVNIDGSKYWWRDGVNDNQLIPMPSGGGGSTSDDITNESSVSGATVTDALNALSSAVTSATNTANTAAQDAYDAEIAANNATTTANAANAAALAAQSVASSALTAANGAQATAESALNGLNDKVDKVTGKGLSTEDYTTIEKNKLAGIEAGAQVNAVTSVAGKTGAVTLVKADVGLSNVDNTSDADKPVSTATQNALNGKQNSLGFTPENAANKGAVNGYAGLGSDSRVPAANAPTVIKAVSQNTSQVSVGAVTTEQILQTITIPANTLAVGDMVRITGLSAMSGSGGTRTTRVRQTNLAGTALLDTTALSATTLGFPFEMILAVVSTTQITCAAYGSRTYQENSSANRTITVDLTQSITFVMTGQKAVSGDVLTAVHFGAVIQKA